MEPTSGKPEPQPSPEGRQPLILSRAEHSISRKDIHESALRVLYRLAAFGYRGFLVGGGVRDLFLGKEPKDFDIGTDARPSRIKKLFRNCRIIGRRFRIAHVYFPDGTIVEVSTFRRGAQKTIRTDKGDIVSDNEYGSPEEDALRRDITINGLFYDIQTFGIIDYVGGVQDLRDGIVRTIAPPGESFQEDPVRMIRVQRHAARTAFEIEEGTLQAVYQHRAEIRNANPARLLEETLKDLRGGASSPFFRLMMETHLLDSMLPLLGDQLRRTGPEHPLWARMEALDRWTSKGRSFSTPVLLSVFLQTVLFRDPALWLGENNNPPDVWRYVQTSWREISKTVRISRRDMERIAQILISFRKLRQSEARKRLLPALMKKSYLFEALDFFELDLEARGLPTDRVQEWRSHAPPPAGPEARYRQMPRRGRRPQNHPGAAEPGETTERTGDEEFTEAAPSAEEPRKPRPRGRRPRKGRRGRRKPSGPGAER